MMPEKIYSVASVDRLPGVAEVTTGGSQKDVEVPGVTAGIARVIWVTAGLLRLPELPGLLRLPELLGVTKKMPTFPGLQLPRLLRSPESPGWPRLLRSPELPGLPKLLRLLKLPGLVAGVARGNQKDTDVPEVTKVAGVARVAEVAGVARGCRSCQDC